MNTCICQILDVDLFKRLVVTLKCDMAMAKDIGVESFCSEDTGTQFTFYVGIMLLHRCKSCGSKGSWVAILKEGSTQAFLGCINLDSDRLADVKLL